MVAGDGDKSDAQVWELFRPRRVPFGGVETSDRVYRVGRSSTRGEAGRIVWR